MQISQFFRGAKLFPNSLKRQWPPTFGKFIAKEEGKFNDLTLKQQDSGSQSFYFSSTAGETEEQMDREVLLRTENLPLNSVGGEHRFGEHRTAQQS